MMNKPRLSLSLLLCASSALITSPLLAQPVRPEEPKVLRPGQPQVIQQPATPGLTKEPAKTKNPDKPKVLTTRPSQPTVIEGPAKPGVTKAPKKDIVTDKVAVSLYNEGKALEEAGWNNRSKAQEKYKQSADLGYAPAQYEYATMLLYRVKESPERIQREKSAIEYLRKAAQQDNLKAQWGLALLLLRNADISLHDFGTGTFYLKKVANTDKIPALLLLGDCYAYGKGVDKDFDRAMRNYKKALELGHTQAYGNIGALFLNQNEQDVDLNSAESWLYKGYKLDYLRPYALYGHVLILKHQSKRGLEILERAAQADSTEAKFALYQYYKSRDHNRAMDHLKDAAKFNHPAALYTYAKILEAAGQTAQIRDQAREMYEKAANNDYLPAQILLAERYEHASMYYPPDYDVAIYWWKRVANRTLNPVHSLNVARIAQSPAVQRDWYRKAANQGSLIGKQKMLIHDARHGGRIAAQKAMLELIRLYNTGHHGLAYNIAQIYVHQKDWANSITQAIDWFTKAGENGSAASYYWLARIYGHGTRVPKDAAKAQQYMKLAESLGSVSAMVELANAHDTRPSDPDYNWVLGYQSMGKDAEIAKVYWTRAASYGSASAIAVARSRGWSYE